MAYKIGRDYLFVDRDGNELHEGTLIEHEETESDTRLLLQVPDAPSYLGLQVIIPKGEK